MATRYFKTEAGWRRAVHAAKMRVSESAVYKRRNGKPELQAYRGRWQCGAFNDAAQVLCDNRQQFEDYCGNFMGGV